APWTAAIARESAGTMNRIVIADRGRWGDGDRPAGQQIVLDASPSDKTGTMLRRLEIERYGPPCHEVGIRTAETSVASGLLDWARVDLCRLDPAAAEAALRSAAF